MLGESENWKSLLEVEGGKLEFFGEVQEGQKMHYKKELQNSASDYFFMEWVAFWTCEAVPGKWFAKEFSDNLLEIIDIRLEDP